MRSLSIVLIMVVACSVSGKTIYVDDDSVGANDGSSWENAYIYLQDALADANSSAKPVEIRVAQGVYMPDRNTSNPDGTSDLDMRFHLISGVTLQGGYAGLTESDCDRRDAVLYKSILNGDLLENDISDNPDDPSRQDNSACVVDGSYTNRTAMIDGFDITGGTMPSIYSGGRLNVPYTDPNRSKGGMRNISGSPSVFNCCFYGNTVDVYNVVDSAPLFENCYFQNPRTVRIQGVVGTVVNISGHPEIKACVFEHNGNGAVYCKEGDLYAYECKFLDNYSSPTGERVSAIHDERGRLTLLRCEFNNNSGNYGGAVYAEDSLELNIRNCVFSNNTAESGGAIYIGRGPALNNDTSVFIADCRFSKNSADFMAGAIVIHNNAPVPIINCVFESNRSPYIGAIKSTSQKLTMSGCLVAGSQTTGILSYKITNCAIYCKDVEMLNCTIHGNRGVYKYSSLIADSATVSNSIVWDVNSIHTDESSTLNVFFSNSIDAYPGEGNTSIDPCFVDSGYWDPNGTPEDANDDFWVDGDYHLKSQAGRWDPSSASWVQDDVTSSCIDAGDPASPIGDEPFPNGGVINMGAYGGTAEASKSWFDKPVCETIVAGDINGDCVVDFQDYIILARHWLEEQ